MRFSPNGYYIERYVKCDCCGVLIYDDGIPGATPLVLGALFCSAWCGEWKAQKLAGVEIPQIAVSLAR